MNRTENAVRFFNDGYNCAQAVAAAYAGDPAAETAVRAACAFGGGMARSGNVCGAVSGALIALGLAYGHPVPGDPAGKKRTYAVTKEFLAHFAELNGSLLCRELLAGTAAPARERTPGDSRCAGLVRDAAELLERLLAEGGESR